MRQIGRFALNDGLNHLLVHRIGIGVQQAHGNRLDAFRQQLVNRLLCRRQSQGLLNLTLRADALIHHHPQIALHQHRRLVPGEVVEAGPAEIANFEHIPKSLGGDQAGLSALEFQNRIGRHRGAVADFLNVHTAEPGIVENGIEPVGNGAGVVLHAG